MIPTETEGPSIIPSSIGNITFPITKGLTVYGKPRQASFYGQSGKSPTDESSRKNTEIQSIPKK